MTPAELTEWREQSGLSLAGLAALLGQSKTSIYYWEHGMRRIPAMLELALATIERESLEPDVIADSYGTPEEELRYYRNRTLQLEQENDRLRSASPGVA